MSARRRRLAVLTSFSGDGGPERMVLNLIDGLAAAGVAIDLLAIRADSSHLRALPEGVRLVHLGVRHSALAPPALARYLRRERPQALLAAKDRAIRAAVRGRLLSGRPLRLVGRLGTHLSASLAGRHPLSRWWRCRPLRGLYRQVEHLVAVSEGVAADTLALTGLPPARVSVIRNPVITPRLAAQAAEAPGHPWFDGLAPPEPVILGAGRLTEQKDFATLIRAFALLRAGTPDHPFAPPRLMILGEGRQRPALLALARELGVAGDDTLALPGFAANPYAYMSRADLFALSSAWEGSPNVLTEALALGVPAVATDCPSGPREVLRGGAVGPLVPVGDHRALARAMARTLAAPPPPEHLRAAVGEYTAEASAARYLDVLGLRP